MPGLKKTASSAFSLNFRPSLRTRLVGLMLCTSLSLIVILIFFYYRSEQELFNEFQRQTSKISEAVRVGLEGAGEKNLSDPKKLQEYLQRLTPEGIKEISVISTSDRVLASTRQETVGKWVSKPGKELIFQAELGPAVTGDGPLYNLVIPVTSGDSTTGYIHLTLNAEDFSAFLRIGMQRRIFAALAIFSVGTLIAVVLAGRYTRPITEVAEAAELVAAGDLEQQLPVNRSDEIGLLAHSFNQMVATLREDRDLRARLRTAEHLAGVGQFAQNIAHEIKNPLNFISLSIDHMGDLYRPGEAAAAARFESLIGNIKGEIQRISHFAESFLEYGRPFELHRQAVSIATLIDETLELSQARAAQQGIRIRRDFQTLPTLQLDPEFLKTCLTNILGNAFDAMPQGGEFSVSAEVGEQAVHIAFADSGVGIEPGRLDKVFEPYVTTKSGGLGLGLPLTRRIIEEHGGRVDLVSQPGVGTVVTLKLPLEKETNP